MRPYTKCVGIPLVVAALTIAATALGASAQGAAKSAKVAKSTSVKDELLFWIGDAESKLNQLAEAMPEEDYTWRPGEGVRSTGEVYLHVAAANFGVPSFWGVKPPEGFAFEGYEQSLTRKVDIQKALAASFLHLKKALQGATNDDLDKTIELFIGPTTVRGAYMLLLTHAHEHLGQSIAYARTNEVVPPWSAKAEEKEEEESEKDE